MRVLLYLFLALLVNVVPCGLAQSAADLQTLTDLRTASKQMQLEAEGTTPFRLTANYEAFDFLGRPDGQGSWKEEFARPGSIRREVHDSNSSQNYAPEDEAAIGAPAPAAGDTFVQRFLIAALLHPGPDASAFDKNALTFKLQKAGTLTLRCVVMEPKEKSKNSYLQRTAARAYCLAADAPILRLVQGAYGITVTYNSIARFGDRVFAQQLTAQQRGHVRGKLQVTRILGAPELLTANLPNFEGAPEMDAEHTGAVKVGSGVSAGAIVSKVAPMYPEGARQKHISGIVVLHAIISKDGSIESLEVIVAPSDDLAESAVEAVGQWRYKPYLLNGVPTEVDTTIIVNFSFG